MFFAVTRALSSSEDESDASEVLASSASSEDDSSRPRIWCPFTEH